MVARGAASKRSKAKTAGDVDRPLADSVVDEALLLAEEIGWERVRLNVVAGRLEVPLSEVLNHHRDLDSVADRWFRRLLSAMLCEPPVGFAELPACERLYLVMCRWFAAAGEHRRVTGEMLRTKLYWSHPHHWVPMAFNLSRLIQWVREAALLNAGGRRRQVEEIGLTTLFLAALGVWLRDGSAGQEHTHAFLRRRLNRADRLMAHWPKGNGLSKQQRV